MTGTPSTLYTLGVRLKVQPDGLGPLLTKLREITQYGSRAEKAIERIGTAAHRASTKGVESVGKLTAALSGTQAETLGVARAAGLTTARYREAAAAVRALRGEVSHLPRRVPAAPRAASGGGGGGGSAFGDTFVGFFGGGVAANLGGALGGMAGGPVGAMAGQALGGALSMGASATVGAIGSVTRATIELGTEAEMTRASLAGLYQSISGVDANRASSLAASTYRQLRADAAKGVGGLSDYTRAYGELYTPLAQGGASLDQIRQLTRLSLGQGFALRGREGMQLAPLDIVQALTSGVSERQTPFAMAAIRAAGMKTEGFNQLPIQEKIAALVKGFEAFGPAVERIGKTFQAQADTLADYQKQLKMAVTEPVFESVRNGLSKFVEVFDPDRNGMLVWNLNFLSRSAGAAAASLLSAGAAFLRGAAAMSPNAQYASQGVNTLLGQVGMTGGSNVPLWERVGSGTTAALYGAIEGGSRAAAASIYAARAYLGTHTAAGAIPGFLPSDIAGGGKPNDMIARIFTRSPLVYGPPAPSDADRAQSDLLDEIRKMNEEIARGRNVTVKMEAPVRLEWGNDRTAARSLETLILNVAEQAAVARTVSTGGVFALSGGA